MIRRSHIIRFLLIVVPLVALIPVGRMVMDWVEIARLMPDESVKASSRGFDWVVWEDQDGRIIADYVFPRGPAERAGIRQGDEFYELDYQVFFNADALKGAIEGIPPGSERTYSVMEGDEFLNAPVTFSRYPTFLYPLSSLLWQFSLWGFTFGAFFHALGLFVTAPLAFRNVQARSSMMLILVASLWMFGNLIRLFSIELLGPPETATVYDRIFATITLVSLVGWIGFPAMLNRKILCDSGVFKERRFSILEFVLFAPPILLGLFALAAAINFPVGPFNLEGLAAPILFFASCYIALAAVIILISDKTTAQEYSGFGGRWSRAGSTLMLVISMLASLSILGVVPLLGVVNDTTVGWIIVSAQLLSILPVMLVSFDTIRHGKLDDVFSRAITYVTVLGIIFFLFTGGLSLMDPWLNRIGASTNIVAGLYVIVLLILFERLAHRVRSVASHLFATDRERTRKKIAEYYEKIRNIIEFDALIRETIDLVGDAFRARTGALFICPSGPDGHWLSFSYHPTPPFLTQRILKIVWPHIQPGRKVWSSNPELNEASFPHDIVQIMNKYGVRLSIPITGEKGIIGLMLLGPKTHRRAIYNLEDIDMLRTISHQLVLAFERLELVEREKMLVRETAEAQMVALRAQINPHFLFNALNTIVSLIEERPEEAENAVEDLSSIFRHVLRTGERAFVTVEEELNLVSHYLSVEKARFGEKLEIALNIDPAVKNLDIPAFTIQTFAENAVKHGLEKKRSGGTIRISCNMVQEMLTVRVEDSGVGIPILFGVKDPSNSNYSFFGIGLKNVKARIEKLYGDRGKLSLISDPKVGTCVTMKLPVQVSIQEDDKLSVIRDE